MTNDGGPAFPSPPFLGHLDDGRTIYDDGPKGMSLRDYFAGLAMQAIVSAGVRSYKEKDDGDDVSYPDIWEVDDEDIEGRAKMAYKYADAMLNERARNEPAE